MSILAKCVEEDAHSIPVYQHSECCLILPSGPFGKLFTGSTIALDRYITIISFKQYEIHLLLPRHYLVISYCLV